MRASAARASAARASAAATPPPPRREGPLGNENCVPHHLCPKMIVKWLKKWLNMGHISKKWYQSLNFSVFWPIFYLFVWKMRLFVGKWGYLRRKWGYFHKKSNKNCDCHVLGYFWGTKKGTNVKILVKFYQKNEIPSNLIKYHQTF